MEQAITISRPPAEVLDYLADPAHIPDWLPQLRREEGNIPQGGLHRQDGKVSWDFEPRGEWHVTAAGQDTRLTLRLDKDVAIAADPTEPETPREAALHAAEAALQSLKSHLERAGGGDPDLRIPDAPSRAFGHDASEDTDRQTRGR
ncbi:SRPBCC family protein [Pseudoroseomonas globiformis]|uniref:SRPBCC family protein n=1 Tax=Teichococcus globiformis TaxID=2307229 RepID=A0ABV7G769_9PROT